MINVYRKGTQFNRDGISFDMQAISSDLINEYRLHGWVSSFDELKSKNMMNGPEKPKTKAKPRVKNIG